MFSNPSIQCVLQNPLSLPFYVKDHFKTVIIPMFICSASVTLVCQVSQWLFAQIGSPEAGAPLVIAASLFCYKLNGNSLEEPTLWAAIGTLFYALLMKAASRPMLITALAVAAFTYYVQTHASTSTNKSSPPTFWVYVQDPAVHARIKAFKQSIFNKAFILHDKLIILYNEYKYLN